MLWMARQGVASNVIDYVYKGQDQLTVTVARLTLNKCPDTSTISVYTSITSNSARAPRKSLNNNRIVILHSPFIPPLVQSCLSLTLLRLFTIFATDLECTGNMDDIPLQRMTTPSTTVTLTKRPAHVIVMIRYI
ncbi:hypothetical protein NEOLI_004365 [Neolecta irregularis DAH-3]|uniref:Uncharacterized protein n=1 Tax=Neolecta irregularis (strain DAH-3) TaxID=1198029 RepID=A0A1U7LL87_NEOID|nr:hypothetical protein NEOLI_004365 [Neolecta irregularis DAH-3]|eukprot:OLL23420.1 hypothetical protein NEOLI_004365 [Neolecta irregularis DAH-3]